MQKLQISTTPTKLNISTKQARLNIQSSQPELDLRTEHIKVKIKSTQPKVQIDQSQCFAESGLKKPIEFTKDNASFAFSKGMEAIGTIVDQGNQMADIHKGAPIPDQAIQNAYDQFVREFNMVTMPKSRPDIQLIRGRVDIKFEGGKVTNNTRAKPVNISYNKGKVDIYVKQHYRVEINVVNTYV